jgi:ATP-dependent DNA helicase RecG
LNFRLGDVYQDAGILKRASDAVEELVAADPDLTDQKHRVLRNQIYQYLSNSFLETTL